MSVIVMAAPVGSSATVRGYREAARWVAARRPTPVSVRPFALPTTSDAWPYITARSDGARRTLGSTRHEHSHRRTSEARPRGAGAGGAWSGSRLRARRPRRRSRGRGARARAPSAAPGDSFEIGDARRDAPRLAPRPRARAGAEARRARHGGRAERRVLDARGRHMCRAERRASRRRRRACGCGAPSSSVLGMRLPAHERTIMEGKGLLAQRRTSCRASIAVGDDGRCQARARKSSRASSSPPGGAPSGVRSHAPRAGDQARARRTTHNTNRARRTRPRRGARAPQNARHKLRAPHVAEHACS